MKYKPKEWHAVVLIIAIILLYSTGFFRPFLGSSLTFGDGFLLYGEYTLSDFIYPDPINSTSCQIGYSYNEVREMCELSSSFLAEWANNYGFTNLTSSGWFIYSGTTTSYVDWANKTDESKYWNFYLYYRGASAVQTGGDPAMILSTSARGSGKLARAVAISQQGFKGKNFRADVIIDMNAPTSYVGSGNAGIYLSPDKSMTNDVVSGPNPLYSSNTISVQTWHESQAPSYFFEGTLELKPSVLNPNIMEVYLGGIKKLDVDVSTWEDVYIITYSSSSDMIVDVSLIKPRWQPLFSCQMEENDILGYEIFSGPQDISLFSTRYAVKKFCLDHPAVIYDESEGGTTTTAEIYSDMIRGETYSIPDDQVVGLFYIFHNDGSIAVTCPGEAYDVANNRCVVPGGLATICTEGTFDPSSGTCVVTPETRYECPEGGYYDTALAACIYNPPIQYICEYGTYSAQSGVCEYIPSVSSNCPTDTTWNSISGFCESYPASQVLCPPFYAYDSTLDKCTREGEVIDIIPEPVCSIGVLSDDLSKCVYEPPVDTQCISGGLYDSSTGKCVLVPDYDYLCTNGEIVTLEDGSLACQIGLEGFTAEEKTTIQQIKSIPLFAWMIIIGLLLYLWWEKGPKSGLFRK